MGYPDTFEIPVSDTQAYRQFGNSVVVPVIRFLAQALASQVALRQSSEPTTLRQPERREAPSPLPQPRRAGQGD